MVTKSCTYLIVIDLDTLVTESNTLQVKALNDSLLEWYSMTPYESTLNVSLCIYLPDPNITQRNRNRAKGSCFVIYTTLILSPVFVNNLCFPTECRVTVLQILIEHLSSLLSVSFIKVRSACTYRTQFRVPHRKY